MKRYRFQGFQRSLCTVLATVVLFGSLGTVSAQPTFSDIDASAPYYQQVQLLAALGVISGDPDGSFRPNDSLTRSEFAKLAVHLLDKQDEAVAGAQTSAFSDLPPDHWALRYINYCVKNGLILGYPDGTFHPDETLPYSQALTIVLRMLGYTTQDVGPFWPDNYIQKAATLGLTDGMSLTADQPILRGEAILVLGRALETELNPSATGNVKKTPLDMFGYTVIDETNIVATQTQDKSLSADQVKTGEGIYKTLIDLESFAGGIAKVYLDDEKRVVLAYPIEQYEWTVTIEKNIEDNKYSFFTDSGTVEYELDDSFPIYYEGNKSSANALSQYLEPGAKLTFKGKYENRWDYALLTKAQKITPFVATRDFVSGDTSIAGIALVEPARITVYRDGLAAQLTDIKRYDVIYYNPATYTMDVYVDKVTGIYDKALPNKAHVESIELGGKTYRIETKQATEQLDETAGSFKIGERITLLLGKDGEIAGVADITGDVSLDYGVLVNTYSAMSEEDDNKGAYEYYAKLFMADGNTYEYQTNKNYKDDKGKLVQLQFEDGLLVLTRSGNAALSGTVDKASRSIDGKPLAKNVVLFDLVSNNTGQDAEVVTMELSDIKTDFLYEGDIVDYAYANDFGDIGVIVFNNLTLSNTQYGIVNERKVINSDMIISGTYTVDIRGTEQTFTGNVAYSVDIGDPVKLVINNGRLDKMQRLTRVASARSVDAIDYDRIKVGGKVYPMDENVVVYERESSSYHFVPVALSTLTGDNVIEVELYADGPASLNSTVRIIKVSLSSKK